MSQANRENRPPWVAAMILCFGTLAAYAQDDVIERQLKAAPGRDVRAGVFTDIRPDCTPGPLPAIRLVTPPVHGNVTVKRGTLKATNIKQVWRSKCRLLSRFIVPPRTTAAPMILSWKSVRRTVTSGASTSM